MKDCPFCHPEAWENQQIIAENEYCRFIQIPQEILVGSGLIIPKDHRETVFDLTKEEWDATYSLMHEVKVILDEKYNPDGYNLGWNCELIGGQSILHAHLHIIPRYSDEPFVGRGIRYWLKGEENRRI
ncbi:HIT family protein [Halalkalibacillus sediminis]|uniref:HIT family protein n=1 Tax=Halalkalibacillus sediminis TaxID=2018042 RepID=A0A2I0QTH3_9BACI|nr:HIT family protein [Halalkalibacillus sediminis]PKR77609.1 HIT family protein [Halalkalibacillus sediminis]